MFQNNKMVRQNIFFTIVGHIENFLPHFSFLQSYQINLNLHLRYYITPRYIPIDFRLFSKYHYESGLMFFSHEIID